MVKVTINDKIYEVEDGKTIIQACDDNDIEVPRFCYHDKLKVAGNCRMCLVEVDGSPKPVASCASGLREGMKIRTDSEMVRKAREGVMEFLLINHPLDCPICDQGGECDLQDQAMVYGRGESRFAENKRAVEDKNFGPLIQTHMTRCIHCTRCVRFATDIAGIEEIGLIGRGEHAEITPYVNEVVKSELSGNVIDLCPVGALTSKPFAYTARSWELKKTESIDVMDAVGSNIRVDSRGQEVMRILPVKNDAVNEEWITDKIRFSYDGLKSQRLDSAYIRDQEGKLVAADLDAAVEHAAKIIKNTKPKELACVAGDMVDCETLSAAKSLMDALGSDLYDVFSYNVDFDKDNKSSYLFNSKITGIDESDLCFIIGADPKREAPMINARIRKRSLQDNNYKVFSLGSSKDLTCKYNELGFDIDVLNQIDSGAHELSELMKKSSKPMMIIGYGALTGKNGKSILALLAKIAEKYGVVSKNWNGFNILHRSSSIVGALDIGFAADNSEKNYENIINAYKRDMIKTLIVLADDNMDPNKLKSENGKLIYIGHHGDVAANYADVILPVPAFTEKEATYINLEGRVQKTAKVVEAPGSALEDWRIVGKIAEKLGYKDLAFENKGDFLNMLYKKHPHLNKINQIQEVKWQAIKTNSKIQKQEIKPLGMNFYMTNSVCRSSVTMSNCVREFEKS